MTEQFVLGIDTSNYKTSAAIVCGKKTVIDLRRFLKVKEGQRGLRQSEALFQHVQNLPEILGELRSRFDGTISAVSCSTRPRSVEGSYMPCFTAGMSQALSIGAAMNIPVVGFSHQEGHIEAAISSCGRPEGDFLGCHFSGGTCEVLKIKQKQYETVHPEGFGKLTGETVFYDTEIIGGSRDISYGQVLDRAGVEMGLMFPCGQELDEMALSANDCTSVLTRIKTEDGYIHLSGFDTQIRKELSACAAANRSPDALIREAFEKISESVIRMLRQNAEKVELDEIVLSGGVAASRFIKERVSGALMKEGITVRFAEPELSSDNAVGTALLGSRYIWDRNQSE